MTIEIYKDHGPEVIFSSQTLKPTRGIELIRELSPEYGPNKYAVVNIPDLSKYQSKFYKDLVDLRGSVNLVGPFVPTDLIVFGAEKDHDTVKSVFDDLWPEIINIPELKLSWQAKLWGKSPMFKNSQRPATTVDVQYNVPLVVPYYDEEQNGVINQSIAFMRRLATKPQDYEVGLKAMLGLVNPHLEKPLELSLN